MSFLSQLWHWCWFVSTGLYIVLFVLLLRRSLFRTFPVWTLLVASGAAGSTTLIAINYMSSMGGEQYWLAFAVIFALRAVLSFAVFYEIFRYIFRDYPALTELSTRIFGWATIVLIALAVGLAWFVPAAGEGRQIASFFIVGRTFEVVLCGLVLFLLLFSKSIGLSWRTHVFGIALGLGIMASGSLGSYTLGSQIEPIGRTAARDVLDLINEATTLTGVLAWVVYVFAYQEDESTPTRKLPAHDLETWNQELRRLLGL